MAAVDLNNLEILEGKENLSMYQFNTKVAKHYFCKICGIYTHHQRRSNPNEFAVNVGCIDEIDPYDYFNLILKYLKIVLVNHAMYVRNNLCPTYENTFMTHTDNIRIIKYDVGQLIKDHSDVTQNIRGSLTINLNDDYEGGEFRFFGGQVKVSLSTGEAMLFPGEPLWIHGTEPITKGARYAINCFLRQQ